MPAGRYLAERKRCTRGSAQHLLHSLILSLSTPLLFLSFLLHSLKILFSTQSQVNSSPLLIAPCRQQSSKFLTMEVVINPLFQYYPFPACISHYKDRIHANPVADNLDRSQTENVAQPAKTPSRRRGGDKRPNYKESCNGDSGSASDTEEANDGYMDFKGDIPAKKPSTAKKGASRALRPQEAKQDPMSSEQQASDRRVVIKTGKRSHGNDESEPTKPAKRGRKPTANTEIKKFEKDAFALAERFSSKMMDLETTRSENQDLQVQVKALKSELEQAQQAHKQSEASFNQKITQLKNDSQKWRCDLASALEAAKKDSGKYTKVSDSEIKQNWMTLSFNIRGLVTHYLTEMPSDQITVLESQVMDYMLLTPRDISALRTNILRRAIWNILDLAIFSGNRSVWQGDIGSTLTQFLSKKSEYPPQYALSQVGYILMQSDFVQTMNIWTTPNISRPSAKLNLERPQISMKSFASTKRPWTKWSTQPRWSSDVFYQARRRIVSKSR